MSQVTRVDETMNSADVAASIISVLTAVMRRLHPTTKGLRINFQVDLAMSDLFGSMPDCIRMGRALRDPDGNDKPTN